MSVFFNTKRQNSVNIHTPFATSKFSTMILNCLESYQLNKYSDLIIVCIGTDRSTGDSLGPLVGYKLSSLLRNYPNVHVFGTIDEPVHAKNLDAVIREIDMNFTHPFIIAIDACLGSFERVGYVTISDGPLKPGAGVNKDLPCIGNVNITGVVNLGGFMEYIMLQNTRLSIVMKMANVISNSISYCIWKIIKDSSVKIEESQG